MPKQNMTKTKAMNQNGFTLVELLLVITLMAISVGVTGDILMTLLRSYNKTGAVTEVEQNANFVSLKMTKELRNASSVTIPSTTSMVLQFSDGTSACYVYSANNLYRVPFSGTCGATSNTTALVTTQAITGTASAVNLSCTGPSGVCFSVTGASPQVVSLYLVFDQANVTNASFRGSVKVLDTVVIRNTY